MNASGGADWSGQEQRQLWVPVPGHLNATEDQTQWTQRQQFVVSSTSNVSARGILAHAAPPPPPPPPPQLYHGVLAQHHTSRYYPPPPPPPLRPPSQASSGVHYGRSVTGSRGYENTETAERLPPPPHPPPPPPPRHQGSGVKSSSGHDQHHTSRYCARNYQSRTAEDLKSSNATDRHGPGEMERGHLLARQHSAGSSVLTHDHLAPSGGEQPDDSMSSNITDAHLKDKIERRDLLARQHAKNSCSLAHDQLALNGEEHPRYDNPKPSNVKDGHVGDKMERSDLWARQHAAKSSAPTHDHLMLSGGEQHWQAMPDKPKSSNVKDEHRDKIERGDLLLRHHAANSFVQRAESLSTTATGKEPKRKGKETEASLPAAKGEKIAATNYSKGNMSVLRSSGGRRRLGDKDGESADLGIVVAEAREEVERARLIRAAAEAAVKEDSMKIEEDRRVGWRTDADAEKSRREGLRSQLERLAARTASTHDNLVLSGGEQPLHARPDRLKSLDVTDERVQDKMEQGDLLSRLHAANIFVPTDVHLELNRGERPLPAGPDSQPSSNANASMQHEMERRDLWPRQHAADNSAPVHDSFALSGGEQPQHARPDSPLPVPPPRTQSPVSNTDVSHDAMAAALSAPAASVAVERDTPLSSIFDTESIAAGNGAVAVAPRLKAPDSAHLKYGIFFQLERAYILQVELGCEPSPDGLQAFRPAQPSYVGLPPLPSRYATLVLPYDWHLPGKEKEMQRKHCRSQGRIGFHELSNKIAAAWKEVGGEIEAYCARVCEVSLARYKATLEGSKPAACIAVDSNTASSVGFDAIICTLCLERKDPRHFSKKQSKSRTPYCQECQIGKPTDTRQCGDCKITKTRTEFSINQFVKQYAQCRKSICRVCVKLRKEMRKEMRKRKLEDSNDDEKSTKRSHGIVGFNNDVHTAVSIFAPESRADALLPAANTSAVDVAARTELGNCAASTISSPRGCSNLPSQKSAIADRVECAGNAPLPSVAYSRRTVEQIGIGSVATTFMSDAAGSMNTFVESTGADVTVATEFPHEAEPAKYDHCGDTVQQVPITCTQCTTIKDQKNFFWNQRKSKTPICSECQLGKPTVTRCCTVCKISKARIYFSNTQWLKKSGISKCEDCLRPPIICAICTEKKHRRYFAKNQRKSKRPICEECEMGERQCVACIKTRAEFSNHQYICKNCVRTRGEMHKRKHDDSSDDERSSKRTRRINAVNNGVQTTMLTPAVESHVDASADGVAAPTKLGNCSASGPMVASRVSSWGGSDLPSQKLPVAVGCDSTIDAAAVESIEIGSAAPTSFATKRSRWGPPLVAYRELQAENGNKNVQTDVHTMVNAEEACTKNNTTDHTTSTNAESDNSDPNTKSDNSHEYDKHSNRSEIEPHKHKQTVASSSGIHYGGSGTDCRAYQNIETADFFVRRLPKKVDLWSCGDEGVMKRAKDAIESMSSETWRHCCPIPGCRWIFPTEEILSIHLNSAESNIHRNHYRRVGALDLVGRKITDKFAKEHAKLLASALVHIHTAPKEPALDIAGQGEAPVKLLEQERKLKDKQPLLIELVTLWSSGDECVIKRTTKAVEQIPRKSYSFECPVCPQKFPTRECRDLHVIWKKNKRHQKYRRKLGPYYKYLLTKAGVLKETVKSDHKFYSAERQKSIATRYLSYLSESKVNQKQNSFAGTLSTTSMANETTPSLPSTSGGVTKTPPGNENNSKADPKSQLKGKQRKGEDLPTKQARRERQKENAEEQKEKLITRVKNWSGNAADVVKRARQAMCQLTTWQPKLFHFACPVPGCQTRLPTQEILDLHINRVANHKHKAYRQQKSASNHQLLSSQPSQSNQIKATASQLDASFSVVHWTLVIDTCCLVNDKGVEAEKLIELATQQQSQHSSGLKPPVDMVIPYLVWSELDHQTKSENGDLAFRARTVVRTLRKALETKNIASHSGNNRDNILRSQTISESQEAATKFLPRGIQSTNDDHILACALLESERAHQKSAMPSKTEVVLITHDNNLACKAYSNGLKVNSISKFREIYQLESLRQIQVVVGTASNGKAEVIDLLSDISGDEINSGEDPSESDDCLFVIDREGEQECVVESTSKNKPDESGMEVIELLSDDSGKKAKMHRGLRR